MDAGGGEQVASNGFVRARGGGDRPDGDALWFVWAGNRVLLHDEGGNTTLPLAGSQDALGLDVTDTLFMGTLDEVPCMAARLSNDHVPHGYAGHDLRVLYGLVPENVWIAAGVASHLMHWVVNARYCPRTGEPTRLKPGEWAMQCPSCDLLQYPHVTPCVIVLVHDRDRILMTRQASWPAGRYGLVAGFVEPGETLEQCLTREVNEETGIAVEDIRYFASQPWPFPHQLMVGFTAAYAGGPIVVDPAELEDAAWFPIDALPGLPPLLSIARRIIDAHLTACKESNILL